MIKICSAVKFLFFCLIFTIVVYNKMIGIRQLECINFQGLKENCWRPNREKAMTTSSKKRKKSEKLSKEKYHSLYLCISVFLSTVFKSGRRGVAFFELVEEISSCSIRRSSPPAGVENGFPSFEI